METTDGEPVMVSVCCLTFNHADYIRQCLDGFLMQDVDFRYEILVHDDASTDGTEEILREYASRYPDRVLPEFEETNQWSRGRRGNLVFNIPRARGKYLAFCEGDDYWIDRNKLGMQVEYLEQHPEAAICATRCLVKKESGRHGVDMVGAAGDKPLYTCKDFLRGFVVNTSTMMFRREGLVEKIEWGKGFVWGDRVYCIGLTLDGGVCRALPSVTSVYRISGTGLWSGKKHGIDSMPAEMERFYDTLAGLVPQSLKRVVFEEWVFARAWRLRMEGHKMAFYLFAMRHVRALAVSAYLKRHKWCSLYKRRKPGNIQGNA